MSAYTGTRFSLVSIRFSTAICQSCYDWYVQWPLQSTWTLSKPVVECGESFTTTAFSYDTQLPKFNAGAIILNDRAGTGNFNVLNFVGSAAYDYTIDKNKKKAHHIAGGLQAGIIHKSVNMSKLIFPSQYTATNSNPFDPGIPNGEIFSNTNFVLPELNFGVMYYLADDQSKVNPFIGFAMYHLLSPNETFYENDNKLPRRSVAHVGAKINITKDIQLTPKVLIMNEGNANERTISVMGAYA